MNADAVRQAAEQGGLACFGDVTSSEVLHGLGLEHARELVIAINDPGAAERALRAARSLAPSVPIFVRAPYAVDFERLIDAGATDVIVAELEASVAMTERLLARHHVRADEVAPELARIREHKPDDGE
jgi:CPA2 family monovalent cation:H+ antiporter-2